MYKMHTMKMKTYSQISITGKMTYQDFQNNTLFTPLKIEKCL